MIGKRGQFYLIAAIIVVIVLYSLSTKVNVFREQPRFIDFGRLASNYVNEVAKIVNYGIYNNIADINNLVESFTNAFVNYARTRDPNIGLVYIYGDNSKTIIENHLPGNQVITYNSSLPGSSGTLFNSDTETINQLGINIGGENFVHDVPVKLASFSPSFYTASIGSSVDYLKLDVAGTPYLFNSVNGNIFNVVIMTVDQNGNNTVTCSYSGTGAWTTC